MKKKNKRIRKSADYKAVLDFLIADANTAYNYKQIASKLPHLPAKEVELALQLLFRDGKIEMKDRGKYFFRQSSNELTGILDFSQSGRAYLVSDQLDKDLKLKAGDTADAFHGDEVQVRITYAKRAEKPRAKVVRVIKRAKERFVGTVSRSQNNCFVIPDSNKLHTDFYIPLEKSKDAKDGDKVLIEFRDWPAKAKNPYGIIIENFGKSGSNTAEMHAIVAEYGFDTRFDPSVEQVAAQLPSTIDKEEIAKRKDYRKVTTFTIDPVDAKDFDDAISFQALGDDKFEIGVHIADVSHYVQPGSIIDKEAFERATSVYLVDRTIPMLPERLSNELCSLRPHEESLCYAVIFELNKDAKVLKSRFEKTVIYSDHRLAYEDAQEIIDGGSSPLSTEIICLNNIAKKLRANRFNNGSINFETTEFRFELDEQGKPLSVSPKQRFDAHKLIEEYMLLANKHVAKQMYAKFDKAPIPYRVHEEPSVEKLTEFARVASNFGHVIDTSSHQALTRSINKMVQAIDGTLEADILQPLAIRSMEKAYYTAQKTGHFGLAFEHYAHFTSPIRRYPDLITHRLLFDYLNGKRNANKDYIEKQCKHCSEQEQRAVSAERASIKYKQVEYLSQFEGEEFEGMVSGLTEWGIYVEIVENKCEGMIRLKDIKGDHYTYYQDINKVVGQRNKRSFSMGERLWIRIKQTNLQRRTVDFELIDE